eukprot:COSAG02_NODE_2779_length_8046_cov_3.495533_6_plen_203_part_00
MNEYGTRAHQLPPLATFPHSQSGLQLSAGDASTSDAYEVRGIVRGDYMQVTATSNTGVVPDMENRPFISNPVGEYASESGQWTAEAAAPVTSGERCLTGDAAHEYHLQQQQRIYARQYPQQYDLHDPSQYNDDSDVEDGEGPNGRLNPAYLAYGEDHQKPYSGSCVAVNPSVYLPQGVWRPEDNNMYDPEQGQHSEQEQLKQ